MSIIDGIKDFDLWPYVSYSVGSEYSVLNC